MKSSQKKLSYFLLALFVLGAILSIINLFQLPGALERSSVKINLEDLGNIRPVVYRSMALVVGTLLAGFLVLIQNLKLHGNKQQVTREATESVVKEKNDRDAEDPAGVQNSLNDRMKKIRKKINQAKGKEKCASQYIVAVSEALEASQGLLYMAKKEKNMRYVEMISGYAFSLAESEKLQYEFGEGLVGQAAKEGKSMNIHDIPDGYIKIVSGLGSASPNHLLIVPLKQNDEVAAVVELASFRAFDDESVELVQKAFDIMEKETPVQAKDKTKRTVKKTGEKINK